jgi:hypothetical protein
MGYHTIHRESFIMTFRPLRSRQLVMEGLESRCMLDGNVSASVVDGVLRLQGDELGNDVQIRQIAQTYTGEWPGAKYEITGGSRYNGAPTTTINGQESVIVEGVKNGAAIGLGHGNNYLRISNPGSSSSDQRPAAIPGPVTINTGSGMDLIRLYLQNHAEVTVNTGGNNDRIEISRSTLNMLTINADWSGSAALPRAGDDKVVINDTVVNGASKIYMGPQHLNANDNLTMAYGVTFNRGLSFDGVASSLYWRGPTENLVKGPVEIIAEWVSIQDLTIQGSMQITGNAAVSGGGLSDVSVTDQISIFGLGGDDDISFKNVKSAKTLLNGGEGTDTYRDYGGNDLGALTLISIEKQELG